MADRRRLANCQNIDDNVILNEEFDKLADIQLELERADRLDWLFLMHTAIGSRVVTERLLNTVTLHAKAFISCSSSIVSLELKRRTR